MAAMRITSTFRRGAGGGRLRSGWQGRPRGWHPGRDHNRGGSCRAGPDLPRHDRRSCFRHVSVSRRIPRGGDISDEAEEGDNFGESLASGDFNNDGFADLAVGSPGEFSVLSENRGRVNWVYGGASGLSEVSNGGIGESSGSVFPNKRFGLSFAVGDLNGDGFDDLAIGAPGDRVSGDSLAGSISLIPGSLTGLNSFDEERVNLGSVRSEGGVDQAVEGAVAANDYFGSSLAIGDFDNDGLADLAAGIPGRTVDNAEDAGAVQFFDGAAADYLVSYADDEQWYARTAEIVRGMVSDLGKEYSGGAGSGKLFGWNENLEERHIASSTKILTLLLTVEAIEAGFVSLDDEVKVSQLAGETGGSKLNYFKLDDSLAPEKDADDKTIPFIAEGDTMPLRLLIAGMMNQSGNRCSVAIGEHVAFKVTGEDEGDELNFPILMNQRAAELGMTESVFGHPAFGGVTKPQDLITLQAECAKHPLFIELGGLETYRPAEYPAAVLCGTDIDGIAKCNGAFPKFMNIGVYPGRLAWKGGNGGGWFSGSQANGVPPRPDVPWCTESGVGFVNRLGRTLGIALMQTGSGAADAQNLFDYGFRKIFTPDWRATREFPQPGGLVGPEGPIRVSTFALDHIPGGWGVTALIDDDEDLRVNVWALDPDGGQILPSGAAARQYGLNGGAAFAPPRLVDMDAMTSGGGQVSEFFTGNLDGQHLDLSVWRVGDAP
ncbi:MAG: FG-GAP-like repeat-containing protein [Verrucomicrobiales bacterium]